ncbi:hypothetical protein Bca52824_035439 [Brassica carinata]|uniref:Uncharacterized protein n=1 Tax=Brassica carinata TaxID=52824 RepID=A0A8X7V1S6_BRACI|nr:hypothetical protein Bca52824_035439 [Brassica carinata]
MQVQNPGSSQKTNADRFAWSSLRSFKKAPIRKIWSPQDPRPPPRVDEVTKNFNGYQPAINNWGRRPQEEFLRRGSLDTIVPEHQQHGDPQRLGHAENPKHGPGLRRCRTLQQNKEPTSKDTRLKGKPNPTGHAAIRGKTWPNHRGTSQADILYGLRTMVSI